MYKKQKGFTLVEMIIVTVIIGILAGMVITVINIPRIQARSRDSRRIADLKRIQSALELYFSNNRAYPASPNWVVFSGPIINGVDANATVYMNSVPIDPRTENSGVECFGGADNPYGYYYRSMTDGKYILGTVMEMESSVDENTRCSSICEATYVCGEDSSSNYCYCVTGPM
jgi:prepilin-type N-terminal cleavage/methylation domain-containing protein